MATKYYGAICGKGHIRLARKEEISDANNHCQKCGRTLYTECPECSEPIMAKKIERADGSIKWTKENYCGGCGDAYPWGPGLLGQLADKHIPADKPTSPKPKKTIITTNLRSKLKRIDYGEQVIKYNSLAKSCYESKLWLPALSMYIHTIEWSIIAYLKLEEDFDVIEKENNGQMFYLSSNSNSLVGELKKRGKIDQKTLNKIENLNSVERRWTAHHKSGETLRSDVDTANSRLKILVDELFRPVEDKYTNEEDWS